MASQRLLKALTRAAGDYGAAISADTHFVAGVAVVRKWRFVRGAVSHHHVWDMVEACKAFHRFRSGQRFIEHEIIASATICVDDGSFVAVPPEVAAMPARIGGQRALPRIESASAAFLVTKGALSGQRGRVRDLLAMWRERYHIHDAECMAWPATPLLCLGMAAGVWYGDVSVKHQRVMSGQITVAPVGISDRTLRRFAQLDVEVRQPDNAVSEEIWDIHAGSMKRFRPEHMLGMLRASEHVNQRQNLKKSLVNAIRFLKPRLAQLPAASVVHDMVAHRTCQVRNIISLDMASMLCNRRLYKASGQSYRYLAYDASPQCGHEFFVSVERVVARSALQDSMGSGQPPLVETRLLPLCVLGASRMSLAAKTQAHIHQTWLEYGPAVSDVRKANRDVRQCLSDMGTEFGIVEARDVVGACLGQPDLDCDASWLYPLALAIPGPQHIIDSCLHRGLESLPWWPDWQRLAKAVCQWLRPAMHRDLLVHRLEGLGGPEAVTKAHVASLRFSCESFAQWRWKTLKRVTKHLGRMEAAVIVATGGLSASHLSSKDTGSAATFLEGVGQHVFWQRCRFLGQLVDPLMEFSSWVRGCDCHQQDRMAGKCVRCDWAGCRAPHVGRRFEQALQAVDQLRASGCQDMSRAASAILASLDLKMRWAKHTPYMIWEA